MDAHRRLARLLVLTMLAAGAATGLSLSSADASGRTVPSVLVGSGFAGPVSGPARAIDRDIEGGAGSLHVVACAAGAAAARCWIR